VSLPDLLFSLFRHSWLHYTSDVPSPEVCLVFDESNRARIIIFYCYLSVLLLFVALCVFLFLNNEF
jgi:hypothetical protein